jgi:hypothetical protein
MRPAIQMYDSPQFVPRLLADPRDSLAFTDDDLWSYPMPVTPSTTAHGRDRLATWQLVTTRMRKLYQANHSRFYAVVVEVFCDRPGLPRAGSHDDIEVGFVMRRHRTSVSGRPGPSRRLARNLLVSMAKAQGVVDPVDEAPEDVRDLWWADQLWRREFETENAALIDQMVVDRQYQGWFATLAGPVGWRTLPSPEPGEDDEALDDPADVPGAVEETFPMWRLPERDEDCDPARTRSTWFGLIPTYSGEHDPQGSAPRPKLDDRAIYEVRCFVRQRPAPGHEHCPPKVFWGQGSAPFRLAAAMDPQGTSKRTTSITLPDLRRLAARAGQPMGPGGLRIATPPQSQFVFNPFKGIPESGTGAIGAGGGICTFAFELFFMIAFFLFIMFLPIVVLAFQLWWMLALRFCIPPSIAFDATADFFAEAGLLADFEADMSVEFDARFGITPTQALDQIFGTDSTALDPDDQGKSWIVALDAAVDDDGAPIFAADPNFVNALIVSTDSDAALPPAPPPLETKPDDPLCG